MKKIAFFLVILAFLIVPNFVFAGYNGGGGEVLVTRLEVSKDGSTWVNYLAENNSGNQALTVSPGDTVSFRLKTWNTGSAPAANIQYAGSYTNPQYIDAIDPFHAGAQDDLDGDATLYYRLSGLPDMNAGTLQFTLDGVPNGTSETTGFQSGGIMARVKAGTPDQTVITVTIQINGSGVGISVNNSWWNKFSPKAFADAQATTQIRMIVSNPSTSATPAATAAPATFRGK